MVTIITYKADLLQGQYEIFIGSIDIYFLCKFFSLGELDLELDEGEKEDGDDEDDEDGQAHGDDPMQDNEADGGDNSDAASECGGDAKDGGSEESDCALGLRGMF